METEMKRRARTRGVVLSLTLSAVALAGLTAMTLDADAQNREAKPDQAATHKLKPTPKTVAWGHYDASTPPVLRIKSGDTVEVETLSPRVLRGSRGRAFRQTRSNRLFATSTKR